MKSSNALRKLRRWMAPLEHTPIHPQWLVLRQRSRTIAWVNQHAFGVLLDVGSGNGILQEKLKENIEYIGIDYPTTIELGYSSMANIYADAAALPVSSESIDTVALLDVLEHLKFPERAIAEASRVLKKGGKLLIHVPFIYPLHDEPHDYQRWSIHGLRLQAQQQNLKIIDITESTASLETAAALFSIALAKSVFDAITQRKIAMIIAPFVLLLIPAINTIGWFLNIVMPVSKIMPFSYRIILARNN